MEAVEGGGAEGAVVGVDHELDGVDAVEREEALDAEAQRAAVAEGGVLLGGFPAEPVAAPGRNDDSRCQHPAFLAGLAK